MWGITLLPYIYITKALPKVGAIASTDSFFFNFFYFFYLIFHKE